MAAVITAIEAVTPAWLAAVLRRNGFLPSGDVQSVGVRRIHDAQVGSINYFLAVGYTADAPAAAPERLFLKLPRSAHPPDEQGAYWATREVAMYQALAPHQHDLPVVPCYDVAYDPGLRRSHLLLADLSGSHDQPAWYLDIAPHYIERTIECLARVHAYWWEHPDLGSELGRLRTPEEVAGLIAWIEQRFPAFTQAAGDRLSAADRGIYARVIAALPRLWAGHTSRAGKTLVHGDAHFWNFLYPRDPARGETYIVDWQLYHLGEGVEDIAYTIVLRYPHRTPENERQLVERYHHALLCHGVPGYDWATCWHAYRRLAAEQVLYPLRCWDNGLDEAFWSSFLRPALAGFRDLQCDEVLAT